jgi:hypothetical protein
MKLKDDSEIKEKRREYQRSYMRKKLAALSDEEREVRRQKSRDYYKNNNTKMIARVKEYRAFGCYDNTLCNERQKIYYENNIKHHHNENG